MPEHGRPPESIAQEAYSMRVPSLAFAGVRLAPARARPGRRLEAVWRTSAPILIRESYPLGTP